MELLNSNSNGVSRLDRENPLPYSPGEAVDDMAGD